jgi:4-hydroxy-4-methyl-2-oxoglutarate aldolase
MKPLTGRVPREAIGILEIARLGAEVLDGFRALADLTGMSSDACDELGIVGAIPASTLRPTTPGARIVGQALTVMNLPLRIPVAEAVAGKVSRLGEIEAHNLAQSGDVLVIQGVHDISNMGSISASIGKRQGEAGAIVDGAVRDIDHSRAIGYPIWSSSVSPVTGKWRVETVAINVPVRIAGIQVRPGDLALADEVGVCFIPYERAADVLRAAARIGDREEKRQALIKAGAPVVDLAK